MVAVEEGVTAGGVEVSHVLFPRLPRVSDEYVDGGVGATLGRSGAGVDRGSEAVGFAHEVIDIVVAADHL